MSDELGIDEAKAEQINYARTLMYQDLQVLPEGYFVEDKMGGLWQRQGDLWFCLTETLAPRTHVELWIHHGNIRKTARTAP